jgi:hypothetical protein
MNIEFVADSKNKQSTNLIINGQKINLKGMTDIQIALSCDKEKPYLSVVAFGGKNRIGVAEYECED